MMKRILAGAAAGAIGTVALNAATYADMVWRGRPSSQVPAEVAGKIAKKSGLSIVDGENYQEADPQDRHRLQGLGALMGYGTGVGVGVLYGLMRVPIGQMPILLAGPLLGGAAMAASDVPAARLGATNIGEWSASSWAADIVPHLIYGVCAAVVFDALAE